MHRPVVAGVGGGVGTSIVAAALGLDDRGVWGGGPVDVLVCRANVASIEAAQRVVATNGVDVILVVVADVPGRPPRDARAMLKMIKPRVWAVVQVPFVEAWRNERRPAGAARRAHTAPEGHLAPFGRAVQRLATAVSLRCGTPVGVVTQVTTSAPPPHPSVRRQLVPRLPRARGTRRRSRLHVAPEPS